MPIELTILMPCLNEARTLPACLEKAFEFLRQSGIEGEVLVADNGSTDGSVETAARLGARVAQVPVRGYGAALAAGVRAARGRFVIMGDADDSYDFLHLDAFMERLRSGDDLVVGNRFRGGISSGAMPLSHRYFGNPLLTAIGRRFFHTTACGDFYCGLRGFRREAIQSLGLQSRGMEFALEMIVKAGMNGLRISEVPTTLRPDGRDRPPHLRRFRDGWRSLRFYLLMSPRWFFAVPGAVLLVGGGGLLAMLFRGPLEVGAITLDYHTLLYAAAAVVVGYQCVLMAVFAKLMAVETGLHPPLTRLSFLERAGSFERFLVAGLGAALVGVVLGVVALVTWAGVDFGDLSPTSTIRWVTASTLCLMLGGQTSLAGCFLGLFGLLADRRSAATHQAAGDELPWTRVTAEAPRA